MIREGYVAKDALNDRPVEMVMRELERDRGGEAAGSSPPQPVPSVAGQVEDGVRSRHPAGSDAAEPEARPTASEAPGSQPEQDQKADMAKSETGRTRQSEGSRAQAPPRRHQERLFDIDQLDPGMLSNLDDREPIFAQSEEAIVEPLRLLRQQIAGDALLLSGQALLDPEAGGLRAQVLVRFYFDAAATRPVPALNVAYALPDGTAVAVSPEQAANTRLLRWQARIPLSQLPQDLHSLWLKPVLYLDRFGVERGDMVKVSL
ncbi:MAG: hypothetical protein CVV27_05235 [Candidatus Melainabacteria bacterium HGW-Melainabacteria-1]|nr:MAG: hypothetical protein CVV27_05235 [Candidatus Melainabacteria bacterium HGW-Melainabacteria-1]